jgi:hypothetical protein
MPASSRNRTKKILDKYLDEDFTCFANGEDAPSADELAALAQRLAVQFPDEFIQHSTSELGGTYIAANEEVWPRPKPYEAGPFWSFLYGLFVYGASPEVPDWMNLDLTANQFRQTTNHKEIPFLKIIGDPDVYCFDIAGDIVRWNHETNGFEKINKSFFQLLGDEVRELKERKTKKKAEAKQ